MRSESEGSVPASRTELLQQQLVRGLLDALPGSAKRHIAGVSKSFRQARVIWSPLRKRTGTEHGSQDDFTRRATSALTTRALVPILSFEDLTEWAHL